MSTPQLYKIQDIDFSQLKFLKNKKFTNSKFVEIFYNKKSFGLKLPSLRIPFDSRLSYGKIEVNLSLKDKTELSDSFKKFDESIVRHIKEQGLIDTDKLTYFSTLRESKNGDYPPTLKFKIVTLENQVKTLFFDSDKKKISVKNNDEVLEILKKGVRTGTAVQCLGVWANDTMYGVAWKVTQLRLAKNVEQILDECNFEESSNDGNSLDSCTEFLIEE
jgi:hypothetical protein